jgi:hypothetical protein
MMFFLESFIFKTKPGWKGWDENLGVEEGLPLSF